MTTGEPVAYFGEKGEFENEATLKFDDGVEYYVAKDFLKMASPVFAKMVESDFKEKQTGVIELKNKKSTDFLELLNFLHPAVLERITEDKVFRITPLAEEYNIATAVTECKAVLMAILENKDGNAIPITDRFGRQSVGKIHCETVGKCLEILSIAVTFSYDAVVERAIRVISKYPSEIYFTLQSDINRTCTEHYSNLPDNIKSGVLKKRLQACDVTCTFQAY